MVATKTRTGTPCKNCKETIDSTRSYLIQVGRTPLLQASQEIELSRSIQDLLFLENVKMELASKLGREPELNEWTEAVNKIEKKELTPQQFRLRVFKGRRSKDRMVQANLRLVAKFAKGYVNRGLSWDDLIQEGSLGLIRAAEKFDAARGYKFSTYATWWVRQSITRAIAEQSRVIRIPVHLYEKITKIRKIQIEMREAMNRNPTDDEIATRMEITVEELLFIKKIAPFCLSLDTPIGKEEEYCLADLVEDPKSQVSEEDLERELLRDRLRQSIDSLEHKQRQVISLLFGLGGDEYSVSETAEILGLKEGQVRTIKQSAIKQLKIAMK